MSGIPDFLAIAREDHLRLGTEGAERLLDAGRRWRHWEAAYCRPR